MSSVKHDQGEEIRDHVGGQHENKASAPSRIHFTCRGVAGSRHAVIRGEHILREGQALADGARLLEGAVERALLVGGARPGAWPPSPRR